MRLEKEEKEERHSVVLALGLMLTEEEDQVSNGKDFRLLESWAAPGYFFQAEYPVILPEDLAHYSDKQNKVLSMVKSMQILS